MRCKVPSKLVLFSIVNFGDLNDNDSVYYDEQYILSADTQLVLAFVPTLA